MGQRRKKLVELGMRSWLVAGFLLVATGACAITATPTITPTVTPTPSGLAPSQAFTAVDPQGRPMVGATISITDSFGNPVIACLNSTCSAFQTVVNGSGVFQFYAVPGSTYNVVLSGVGVSRQYVAMIPANSGGGGGITSINSLTASALTINTGTAGQDFAVIEPDSSHITLELPSAGVGIGRGLITNGTQSIAGAKEFVTTNTTTFDAGVSVNSVDLINPAFNVATPANACAFHIDNANNQVIVDSCDESSANANFVAVSGDARVAILGEGTSTGAAVQGVTAGSGSGILASSLATGGRAAHFTRSIPSAAVPIVDIQRNVATDSQPMLNLKDDNASIPGAAYIVSYSRAGTPIWGIGNSGQYFSLQGGDVSTPSLTIPANSAEGFGFLNTDSIYMNTASTESILMQENVGTRIIGRQIAITPSDASTDGVLIVSATTGSVLNINGKLKVDKNGELLFAGVSADGTGKVTCVKTNGYIGTCGDAPNGSGVCTCG